MSSAATKSDGETLGPFRLVRMLGAGGMAEVWEADSLESPGLRFALKSLPTELGDTAGSDIRKFWDEAHIARTLSHPNIVRTHDAGIANQRVYLVMELLRGRTLAQLDARNARLPLGFVAGITLQLLEGLAHAHAGVDGQPGLVHRDIKPSNLFITDEGVAKVIDFGLAVLPGIDRTMTRSGVLRGSLPYCSPEHVRHEAMDARADLFSFGLVVHELLTGKRVFNQSTEAGILSAVLWTPVTPLGQIRTDVPEALDQLISSALEKSADDRPDSARAFADAFRATLPAEQIWSASRIAEFLAAEALSTPRRFDTASAAQASFDIALSAAGSTRSLRVGPPGNAYDAKPQLQRPSRKRTLGWVSGGFALVCVATLGWMLARPSHVTPPLRASVVPVSAPPVAHSRIAPPVLVTQPHVETRAVPVPTVTRVARPSGSGWLTVGTRSGWANVVLDGKQRGPTPLFRVPLSSGRHKLEAHRPDGTIVSRTVVVENGREAKLIFSW